MTIDQERDAIFQMLLDAADALEPRGVGAIPANIRRGVKRLAALASHSPDDVVDKLRERAKGLLEAHERAMANACQSDQKLIIIANHGDLALQMLPRLLAALTARKAT